MLIYKNINDYKQSLLDEPISQSAAVELNTSSSSLQNFLHSLGLTVKKKNQRSVERYRTACNDNRISKLEIHAYNPYANASVGNSDEIRILIQQQDLILLPSGSYLYIEGKLIEGTRAADTHLLDKIMLDANSMAFLFDEIRYELNGIEIDRCKIVGITTSIKNLISLSTEESMSQSHFGWFIETQDRKNVTNNFNFCVPLYMLLGFCEDYKRIIINARHELILIRARNDINSIFSSNKFTDSRIELYRVQWRIPHMTLNEFTKLQFLRIIEQNKNLTMAFRSWELYEYSLLPEKQRHTWAVKAATQLEKPRYVILAFRRNKKNDQYSDVLKFSDCDIRDRSGGGNGAELRGNDRRFVAVIV
ncbi:uncharacterized protein [Prorops nasuta]|uniref:uncharacterized protein n=1 Tax=Prorops nasuta TaxID=863751 RepID=UPI0034CD4BFB